MNDETLVVVMIESPQGVANCEEIAAVKGVDAFIGTNDLCSRWASRANSTTRAWPRPTRR